MMKDGEYLLLPPLTNVMGLRASDVCICQVVPMGLGFKSCTLGLEPECIPSQDAQREVFQMWL